MTVSYFFTVHQFLVFSSREFGSLIEDLSPPRSCRDAIIPGAANTYGLKELKQYRLGNKHDKPIVETEWGRRIKLLRSIL